MLSQKIKQLWPKSLTFLKPYPDLSHLLHHLRGNRLARLPRGITRLVSVGCAGSWYFNWFEEKYGPVEEHIGVEYYLPKPNDLPDGVVWITNTAGHMPDVPACSADAIFSGQNIEHLWPEDIVGFFSESYRILENNGLLIIDSPNRSITERLNWSQPEHIIELTVYEIRQLCKYAGFDIKRFFGIWLCEHPSTGKFSRSRN